MKPKNYFKLKQEYWDWLKLLTNEELGSLLRAIYLYEREQKLPEALEPQVTMAFTVIKNNLDNEKIQYEKLCSSNRQKAFVRWQNKNEEQ